MMGTRQLRACGAVGLCTLLVAVGCDGSPDEDAGTDGGGMMWFDAGPGGTDAGPAGTDAGPAGTDAGPEVDAGPGDMDAGPGSMDAGPGSMDAGPGSMDAGPGGMDGGAMDAGVDAGGTDAGLDGGGADAAVAEAGTPDAGPDGGGVCPIVGDFSTTLTGAPFMSFFQFRSDGTWSLAMSRMDLPTSMQTGVYTYLGGSTLTLNEAFGCMISDTGNYTMGWDSTCSSFTMTLVTDPCTSRGMALNGTTFTRLP